DLAAKLLADVKAGKSPDDAIAAMISALPKLPISPAPMAITKLPKDPDAGTADAPKTSVAPKIASSAADDPERPTFVTSSPFNQGGDPVAGLSPDAQHQMIG